MCLAVAGRVTSIDLPFANVDIQGIETRINIELISAPANGDYVLIHAGFAIQRIDQEYFDFLDRALEKMLKEDDEFGYY
ncbi:HypC/HybG/HupF family hydrogenase formation chaperone [Clostridium sp. JNZ J1-5]